MGSLSRMRRALRRLAGVTASCLVLGCTGAESGVVLPDAAPLDLAQTALPDLAQAPMWPDFPPAPIIDAPAGGRATPSNAPDLFAAPGASTGGPCVVEPDAGVLIPPNWLRPRFRWTPAAGQNLFELRLHAASERHDLLVYTTASSWTMPADLWKQLAPHVIDAPMTVTVRGGVWDGVRLESPPAAGLPSTFTVAPAAASGTLAWWSSNGGQPALRATAVGDEASQVLLRPSQAGTACIGCHTPAPDGQHVGFSASADAQNGTNATIDIRSTDGRATEPVWLSAAARLLLARTAQEAPSFSANHFTTGDRVMVSVLPIDKRAEIIWTDLEAASIDRGVGWGILPRVGDLRMAASPSLSHDGSFVVYVAGGTVGGGVTVGDGDLLAVPWASRQGGQATPIPGAHETNWNEYAPSLSADDRLVAYARAPYGQSSFANPLAEVFVIPVGGGTAERLVANDPQSCPRRTSPGLGNSWPRWSPDAVAVGDLTYYWLAFSSKRGDRQNAQIYVSAVIVDDNEQPAKITSTPALYLWSQTPDDNNHTPTWGDFQLPAP